LDGYLVIVERMRGEGSDDPAEHVPADVLPPDELERVTWLDVFGHGPWQLVLDPLRRRDGEYAVGRMAS
jgi:hypothetical protein